MHPDPEKQAEGERTTSVTQPENQTAGGDESSTNPPAADTHAENGTENVPIPVAATGASPSAPVAGTPSSGATTESRRQQLRTMLSSEEDFSALREPLLDEPL